MAKGKYKAWLTDEGLLQIEAWARNGLTNKQIAVNMGIARKTLQEWCVKYSDISDALKKGKEVVDIQVENALLKRALGYKYIEQTKERKTDPQTGIKRLIVTKEVTKEVIPDTTAQIFWLKNRKPDVWRDKKDIDVDGSLNATSSMTDEELTERINKLKDKLGFDVNE